MSEEFKPIRVTLSEEAFGHMEEIMRDAKFRSYSSTIEECIRAVYDVINEIYRIGGVPGDPEIQPTAHDYTDSMIHIIIRMSRFTGRTPKRRGKTK